MLAYAASRPRVGVRQSSPNTLLFIILGHIVLLAVAMSVKEALPPIVKDGPITIYKVPIDKPPPPIPPETKQPKTSTNTTTSRDHSQPQVPTRTEPQVPLGGAPGLGSSGGTGTSQLPPLPPLPPAPPVGISRGATLLTPPADVRPPYPQSKLIAEDEATLKLRLTIDEGRVVAVDPVGRADPVFLASARRHLMAHWRYKPAMKDGQPIPTSIVISLRFELGV